MLDKSVFSERKKIHLVTVLIMTKRRTWELYSIVCLNMFTNLVLEKPLMATLLVPPSFILSTTVKRVK